MRTLLASVEQRLAGAGIENSQREAEWIIEAATGLSRSDLAMTDRVETEDESAAVEAMTDRRVGGEPLQYVTGLAGFRRLELSVGPGVFIPRAETESLAGRAMDLLPKNGLALEIGTGSGAVALAVADERPDVSVWATEYSPEALVWAMRNRDQLGLDVKLVGGDLFAELPSELKGNVDVIASNPPYVPQDFKLGATVIDHEPHVALFADESGLSVIDRLITEAQDWLRPGGYLVLEIGEVQRDAVSDLFRTAGYADVQVHLDLADRARIAEGRWGP